MTHLRPRSVDEASEMLRDACARSLGIMPIGGGTHLQQARAPQTVDVALHTDLLSSVVGFEPSDMTISVQAGMTAADLTALLSEHHCRLPLDVELPDRATIGGMAAVGWAGPRRLGMGTLRDLLIGAKVLLVDGTPVKTGGMVVKNVSGYDLTKLFHGSLGSLGVIVEANFKVLATPAREALVTYALPSGEAAAGAALALFASRLPLAALEASSDGTLAVGCEGHSRDVDRLLAAAEAAAQACDGIGTINIEGHAEVSAEWSRRARGPAAGAIATLRVTTRPSRVVSVATEAEGIALELGYAPSWRADVGTGTVDLSVDAGEDAPLLARLEADLVDRFDAVRVLRCPEPLRMALGVFGRPPSGITLMRALKTQFDPQQLLNGRANVGGI